MCIAFHGLLSFLYDLRENVDQASRNMMCTDKRRAKSSTIKSIECLHLLLLRFIRQACEPRVLPVDTGVKLLDARFNLNEFLIRKRSILLLGI